MVLPAIDFHCDACPFEWMSWLHRKETEFTVFLGPEHRLGIADLTLTEWIKVKLLGVRLEISLLGLGHGAGAEVAVTGEGNGRDVVGHDHTPLQFV